MKKILSAAILTATLALGASSVANAADTKIGVYNNVYVMQNIPQMKALDEKFKKAVGGKLKQLEKLESELIALQQVLQDPKVDAEKKNKAARDAQLKNTEYEILRTEVKEENQKLLAKDMPEIEKKINNAIDKVAKDKGLTIILASQTVVRIQDESIDISKDVVDVVSKSK